MKLKLKKEELLVLSDDAETLGRELTPEVGGGANVLTDDCTFDCSIHACCNLEQK